MSGRTSKGQTWDSFVTSIQLSSEQQQILANPELQARQRSVHAAADIRHPWTEDLQGGLAAPVQPYVFCPAMNLWNPSKNMPLHI